MKTMLAMGLLLLGSGMSHGKDDDKNGVRMDCNKKAESATGAERNRIISNCIRRNASTMIMPPMLGKVTGCNKKAGDMHGDARGKFMEKCMQE